MATIKLYTCLLHNKTVQVRMENQMEMWYITTIVDRGGWNGEKIVSRLVTEDAKEAAHEWDEVRKSIENAKKLSKELFA